MHTVYILQGLKTNEFYKGMSSDLDVRLDRHFSGKSKSTKHMLPLKLIHVELCFNRLEARNMEKFFKSGYGREIIQEIAEKVI